MSKDRRNSNSGGKKVKIQRRKEEKPEGEILGDRLAISH